MKINFKLQWLIDGTNQEIDKRLLQLLEKINLSNSLQIAATDIGVSYRTAWEIIRHWNGAFNSPLCTLERGKGSSLTPLGLKLIQTKLDIESNYADVLNNSADNLNNEIDTLLGESTKKKKITAFTSHDLSINFLQTLCEEENLNIDFNARGSLDALKQLQLSKYNIVGFHFPDASLAKQLAPEYMPLLDDTKHAFIHLATRQQGLIFKSSLTKHLVELKNITRRSINFINRQQGSGTRAIFDQLIKLEGINKNKINGYKKEEFTHTAVAAMIASGQADVGFGLKAAASQFKLSFLPLIDETYVIGLNKSLPEEIKNNIRDIIKDSRLKNKINKLPGYNASLTGKLIHAKKLLYPSSLKKN